MKKKKPKATAKKPSISLRKAKLKDLSVPTASCIQGGMRNNSPRTDCICHAQCATNAC